MEKSLTERRRGVSKPNIHVDLYRLLVRCRLVEEASYDLHREGLVPGTIHSSVGQEATVVGSVAPLRRSDMITGTHRGTSHLVAKGSELGPLIAELLGKRTGPCKGKGGSHHLADYSVGAIGESSIVGASVPIAVGAAWSAVTRGVDDVVVAFFGDGGANQGVVFEVMNMAALWRLPVIFLCENNGWAISTRTEHAAAGPSLFARAEGFGIPGMAVDGQDVMAVREIVSSAIERARAGDGPTFVEARTYRIMEHATGVDRLLGTHRDANEIAGWRERDPLKVSEAALLGGGLATDGELETIRRDEEERVQAAVAFAKASDDPDPAEAFDDLYATPLHPTTPSVSA
jgi:TPP-dependent pyruvate/acetoin dehydrogenase alpha subunit